MIKRSIRENRYFDIADLVLGVFFLGSLYLISRSNYLLFHSIAELFGVAVISGIFMVAWNSRRLQENHYLLFIGIGYLFMSAIDLAHLLAYKGINIIPFADMGANVSTQLWLAGRFMQSATLLIAPLFLTRKIKINLAFLVYGLVTLLLGFSIFLWKIFPTAFIDGSGLTSFKKISEYFICLILAGAIVFLFKKRKFIYPTVFKMVNLSILTAIVSELAFTSYISVYGPTNMLGHLFRILSFYFIYKAVIEATLKKPFNFLFRNLKISEEALKKSEQKFRSVAQTANDAIISADTRGNIIFWNNGARAIFGYTPSEALGKPLTLIMPERFHNRHKKGLNQASNKRKKIIGKTIEMTGVRKDKTEFPLELSLAKWETEEGIFFTAIIRDITEPKKAEEKLISYAKRLEQEKAKDEALLSSIGDGIVATDFSGKILYANKAFEELTGRKLETLKDKQLVRAVPLLDRRGNLIVPEERPTLLALSSGKKITASAITSPSSFYIQKNKIKIPLAITATPIILDDKIIGAISVFRDITIEKEIDQAKTEFISMAAHQLRTPLATIGLTSEMLLRGVAGEINKEGKEYLKDISKDIKSMAEMIETFLNVSRIELGTFPMEPKASSIIQITDNIINEVMPQIKSKKLRLNKDYEKNLPTIKIDAKIMRIVLENLLSNAIKYTPPKGQISIGIKKQKSDAVIKVSDTGLGIPLNQQSKVFAKMYRAGNVGEKTEGVGLGLYVVKSAIEQASGKVWFESKENQGTSFYIAIPLSGMKKKETNNNEN
ncbi:MAG: PAS domain S-box protein [Candidatus Portnoybacteria bacterium]|nr:PAS domain S-box protein [Candidatus Portnoybacteria bacterium]